MYTLLGSTTYVSVENSYLAQTNRCRQSKNRGVVRAWRRETTVLFRHSWWLIEGKRCKTTLMWCEMKNRHKYTKYVIDIIIAHDCMIHAKQGEGFLWDHPGGLSQGIPIFVYPDLGGWRMLSEERGCSRDLSGSTWSNQIRNLNIWPPALFQWAFRKWLFLLQPLFSFPFPVANSIKKNGMCSPGVSLSSYTQLSF